MSYRSDISNLPAIDREWSHKSGSPYNDEEIAIEMALGVLAKHAFERRDSRMCGRVLAAKALCSPGFWWLLEDCTNLLPMPALPDDFAGGFVEMGRARREILIDQARSIFVSGIRRRPRALLRAEARGILFCLRWLYRAGLLERRALSYAELAPWRRATGAPETAHPNILGPLPPAGSSLN